MEKIIQVMSEIPKDKLLHCVYGMVVFTLVVGLVGTVVAAMVVTGVALVKEIADVKGSGFSWKDITATVVLPWLLVVVL